MAALNEIKVNELDENETIAKVLKTLSTEVEELFEKVSNVMNQMSEEYWHGNASEQTMEKYNNVQSKYNTVINNINSYSESISYSTQNYQQTDTI